MWLCSFTQQYFPHLLSWASLWHALANRMLQKWQCSVSQTRLIIHYCLFPWNLDTSLLQDKGPVVRPWMINPLVVSWLNIFFTYSITLTSERFQIFQESGTIWSAIVYSQPLFSLKFYTELFRHLKWKETQRSCPCLNFQMLLLILGIYQLAYERSQ